MASGPIARPFESPPPHRRNKRLLWATPKFFHPVAHYWAYMDFIADDADEANGLLNQYGVRNVMSRVDCYFQLVTPSGSHLLVRGSVEKFLGLRPRSSSP
jgi:hypothetical protein